MTGISLIICTYNGKDRLGPTLECAIRQKTRPELLWELLVVDNNSSDGSLDYCKEVLDRTANGISWRAISEPVPGLSYARKSGIVQSLYRYVVFCDDDNWLSENYIQRAFDRMEAKPDVGVLGGLGIPELGSKTPDWFDRYSKSYAVGPQSKMTGYLQPNEMIYGAGMVLRKDALIKLFSWGFNSFLSDRKGNDLVSGGDNEICLWYRYFGQELYYDDRLTFKHIIPDHRLTREYLLKRALGKGKTEAIFHLYATLFQGRNKVRWVDHVAYWYAALLKRFLLWGFFSITPFTFDRRLKRNVLISSLRFRITHYRYLQKCLVELEKLVHVQIPENQGLLKRGGVGSGGQR